MHAVIIWVADHTMKLFFIFAVIGLASCASLHEGKRSRRSAEDDTTPVNEESTTVAESTTEAAEETRPEAEETTTTTDAPLEESGNKKCEALVECFNNDDCNGGTCLGAFLGTCNCNACMNYWRCDSDADCGGFKEACNKTTGLCDCIEAFASNGFEGYFDGFSKLCNTKACSNATASDDCFGLPCQSGRCIC